MARTDELGRSAASMPDFVAALNATLRSELR